MYKDYKNVQHRPFGPQITGESDFDIALEDIPVLEPSGIFKLWVRTMQIGGVILIILGLLLLFNITCAEAGLAGRPIADQPAAVFNQSRHTVYFRVFRFYDAKFQVLCYVNQESMQCIPLGKLTPTARQRIEKMVEGAMNHMQIPPQNIFKIP